MGDNNISIAPTLTMTTEQYADMGKDAAVKLILETCMNEDWGRLICKPVYGQEGIDAKFFEITHEKSLGNYLERCMKKYPGIVIQKVIEGFGDSKKSPELRMYYVGNQYQYSVCANDNCIVRPKEEGGGFETPLNSLKNKTRKILRSSQRWRCLTERGFPVFSPALTWATSWMGSTVPSSTRWNSFPPSTRKTVLTTPRDSSTRTSVTRW